MAPSLAPVLSHFKIDICSELVGMAGFEPAASCSQSRRANQAAPHPVEPFVAYSPAGHDPVPTTGPGDASSAPGGVSFTPPPAVVVRRWAPYPGTLSVLARRAYLAAGHAGVAQWQSPSLPSWS